MTRSVNGRGPMRAARMAWPIAAFRLRPVLPRVASLGGEDRCPALLAEAEQESYQRLQVAEEALLLGAVFALQ